MLEAFVTIATAHQHHSEARWEVAAAYFGTVVGYMLIRLLIWVPFAAALLFVCWLRRRREIIEWAFVAVFLEFGTTLVSILFRDATPSYSYGIFYHSFVKYASARLAAWIPLAACCLAFLRFRKRQFFDIGRQ
jgi:hypothetical protein